MKILVQKFGGTSMANNQVRNKAVEKIIKAKQNGFSPVVVVSAIGRKGAPYATDSLINIVSEMESSISRRDMDLLMACGEIISSVVMVSALQKNGYKSKAMTGWQAGIVTDDNFGNSGVIKVTPNKILAAIQNGYIPVVAGFQGITEDGDITTLGRGGSDTTAAVLGEALSAHAIEIYTDVDGIMTADPRIVPNAVVLKQISYSEVFQIADQGAKVIHPRAVEIAMRDNIPLIIKNTLNDSPGTVISSYCKSDTIEQKIDPDQVVTGIAHIMNRTQVIIEDISSNKQNELLLLLAKNHISIDLINIFPDKMIFTIEGHETDKIKSIFDSFGYHYSFICNCSKISAIGNRMRGVPGVMSRIIKAMTEKGIKVLQTADSHTTISCLVMGEDTVKAVLALHDEFNLYKR